MTNGDKIRAMTDEEMAKTSLSKDGFGHHCDKRLCYKYGERPFADGNSWPDCDKCLLDWLKQEVSE